MTHQLLPLGQYVTVASREGATGTAHVGVRHTAGTVVLHPLVAGRQPFVTGQTVFCSSTAGHWSTQVQAVDDDALHLAAPSWLARRTQRQQVRVPCSDRVQLEVAGRRFSGRCRDVSAGGAAVVIEHTAQLGPGVVVASSVPPGGTLGTVQSVRPHDHPLLRVVGIAWSSLEPVGAAWLDNRTRRGLRLPG